MCSGSDSSFVAVKCHYSGGQLKWLKIKHGEECLIKPLYECVNEKSSGDWGASV